MLLKTCPWSSVCTILAALGSPWSPFCLLCTALPGRLGRQGQPKWPENLQSGEKNAQFAKNRQNSAEKVETFAEITKIRRKCAKLAIFQAAEP